MPPCDIGIPQPTKRLKVAGKLGWQALATQVTAGSSTNPFKTVFARLPEDLRESSSASCFSQVVHTSESRFTIISKWCMKWCASISGFCSGHLSPSEKGIDDIHLPGTSMLGNLAGCAYRSTPVPYLDFQPLFQTLQQPYHFVRT